MCRTKFIDWYNCISYVWIHINARAVTFYIRMIKFSVCCGERCYFNLEQIIHFPVLRTPHSHPHHHWDCQEGAGLESSRETLLNILPNKTGGAAADGVRIRASGIAPHSGLKENLRMFRKSLSVASILVALWDLEKSHWIRPSQRCHLWDYEMLNCLG